MDLLTASEERKDESSGYVRFDIELLADRLRRVTNWFSELPVGHGLPLGYFGASTGAAAALVAAAGDARISAVVSRGGRPDLAGAALLDVTAATLLIVGSADSHVLSLNRRARLSAVHAPRRPAHAMHAATRRSLADRPRHCFVTRCR